MKCQEFLSNLDGLARGALSDAVTREEASAHGEACATCAARLADERALTAGLRALAATMSEASAPAGAESALLSAFRSRAAATVAHSNVVSLSERAGARQWSWVKTVAVAAMAAAAVALFMLVPPYLSSTVPARQSASNRSQGAPVQTHNNPAADAGPTETASANVGRGSASSDSSSDSSPDGAFSQDSRGRDEEVASRTPSPRRAAPVRATEVSYGGGVTRSSSSSANAATAAESADAREITTEFIPLVQGAGFAQSEGVHLVRVELPRSALSSFGIPVNAENSGGRVKADVLLGEDGTARAIRFVR